MKFQARRRAAGDPPSARLFSMNSIVQTFRDRPLGEPEERGPVDYPLPRVLIRVDEIALSKERGTRVLRPEEFADELIRLTGRPEAAREATDPLPASAAAAVPDSGTLLLDAARAVHTARERLTHIDGRLADIGLKSHDINQLKIAVAEAREQRAKLLSDALLAGKKANAAKADERCVGAQAALDKREDESIAIERALVTLRAQHQDAHCVLRRCEAAYKQVRDDHVNEMSWSQALSVNFHGAIVKARECLAEMAAPYRDRLLSSKVDLDSGDLPAVEILQEFVIRQAQADLVAADEHAAVPPPPLPTSLGWVWKDGLIHDEPEPVTDVVDTTGAADPYAVGFVTTPSGESA
jgi:hypothetical protein